MAASLEEILQDSAVHVVSIASYDNAHGAEVKRALEAGKHVFVEKPLCRTVEELRAIKAAWSQYRGRVKLSSNLVLRAAPIYQWLKQRVEAGEFGNLYAFDGEYLYGRLSKITEGWRKNVSNYSVMLGGGVHLIDLMVWLTGQRPSSVYASGNRICTRDTAFAHKDYVTAILDFPSGLVGRITANFGCVHPHQHVVGIFGTGATFLLDDAGPRCYESRDPAIGAKAVNLSPLPSSKGALIPRFISAIVNNQNLDEQTQEIFGVISIGLACDQALGLKKVEEVHYI